MLAVLAGAQHASLNSVSVLQQVVNYLMEPVGYPAVQTVVLCPYGFPLQMDPFWGMEHQNLSGITMIFTHS